MGGDFLWRTFAIGALYKCQAARAHPRRGLKWRGMEREGRGPRPIVSVVGATSGAALREAQTMLLRAAASQPWRTCGCTSSHVVPFFSCVHSCRSLLSS